MAPLRWAIVGAGGMGQAHVRTVLQRTDTRLVAACDVNPSALDALPPDVERFADWRSLVERTELDAASVILPHYLYPEVVGALLGRGVHVLKEKPFARNLEDALTMGRAAQAADRQLVVAGQYKFKASFEVARRQINALGSIFLARANILYRSTPIAVDGRWGWRGQKKLSGGVALVDSGWHILELLTLLRGLPRRVTAATGTMRIAPGDHDVDEQVALILDYADGGIATVVASFVTQPDDIRITLYGTQATLDVDLRADRVTLVTGGVAADLTRDGGRDPMVVMYDQFIEGYATGLPSAGSWAAAIQVQRIVEAGYQSIDRGGQPVDIDELPADLDRLIGP